MTIPRSLKPRLGISACLLGERVRYDGAGKLDISLRDELGRSVEWVPVCPEAECGLGVPREAMRLEIKGTGAFFYSCGSAATSTSENRKKRLLSPLFLVTRATGIDHTERMQAWIAQRLDALAGENIAGFVLKARSPSCGLCVEICDRNGKPCGSGPGLWARALAERFPALPVEEAERLHDARIREGFLERILLQHQGGARRKKQQEK